MVPSHLAVSFDSLPGIKPTVSWLISMFNVSHLPLFLAMAYGTSSPRQLLSVNACSAVLMYVCRPMYGLYLCVCWGLHSSLSGLLLREIVAGGAEQGRPDLAGCKQLQMNTGA